MNKPDYNELMELTKDYIDTFDTIFRLTTLNEDEIDKLYNDIKSKLIETKKVPLSDIFKAIQMAALYNNRYLNSYWLLFKKFFNEYHPLNGIEFVNQGFAALYIKEYNTEYDESFDNLFSKTTLINGSLSLHEKNSIYWAIMFDNKDLFIQLIEENDFDINQIYSSAFYPIHDRGFSLIELCCYYGAVNCFKLLRTKFKSQITDFCLDCSFLSGKPDIMNECLKELKPSYETMPYAIISHNIDFVMFLQNEYDLKFSLEDCVRYYNLHLFLVYLDQTKNINECFLFSPHFHCKSLCEYLLSHGADINSKSPYGETAIHNAVLENCKEIVELLIIHGIEINVKNDYNVTPIDIAATHKDNELAEILISNGADISDLNPFRKTLINSSVMYANEDTLKALIAKGVNWNAKEKIHGKTALHHAAQNNKFGMVEFLVAHDVDINSKDKYDKTPLHYAVINNNLQIEEFLISHGADINAKDNQLKTAIHYAAEKNRKEILINLISHGIEINSKDNLGQTALHIASMLNNSEIVKILVSHGADINA